MERTYEYQNGTIHVIVQKSYDQERLKKATQEFLKKVISEGTK